MNCDGMCSRWYLLRSITYQGMTFMFALIEHMIHKYTDPEFLILANQYKLF